MERSCSALMRCLLLLLLVHSSQSGPQDRMKMSLFDQKQASLSDLLTEIRAFTNESNSNLVNHVTTVRPDSLCYSCASISGVTKLFSQWAG
ncbi:hypothetical protein FHG87_015061 [Trinorchestia longiramus]|nr:hypothetical protein FHG87_015061 [Trinorchestia longiramus]